MFPPKSINYEDFDPTEYEDFVPEKTWWERASETYDKYNPQLTGGWYGREAKKFVDAAPIESDSIVNSSFGDKYPGLAKFAAQVEGFGKGLYEGKHQFIDEQSRPAAIVGNLAGGAGQAAKGLGFLKTAKSLSGLDIGLGAPELAFGIAENNPIRAAGGFAQIVGGGTDWSGYGAKPKAAPTPDVKLPENFGPDAYAGPERRVDINRPPANSEPSVIQEYKDKFARGEDVRSKESIELLNKKSAVQDFRNEAAQQYEDFDPTEFANEVVETTNKNAPTSEQIISEIDNTQRLDAPQEQHQLGEVMEYNGQYYTYEGVNPDTGKPKWRTATIDDLDFEVVDPDTQTTMTNASGESAMSGEAIGRNNEMRNQGKRYVMYDKNGREIPTLVEDEATHHVPNGMTLAKVGPNGIEVVSHRGGKVPEFDPLSQVRSQEEGELLGPETDPFRLDSARMAEGVLNDIIDAPQVPIKNQFMNQSGFEEPIPSLPDYNPVGPMLNASQLDVLNPLPPVTPKAVPGMSGFGPPPPPKPPGIQDELPFNDPYKLVQLAKLAPVGKEKDSLFKLATDAARELLTSLDLSAFRQAAPLAGTKAFYTSIDDMFKALGSKRGTTAVYESIINDPSGYFKPRKDINGAELPSIADKAGLQVNPNIEENMGSKIWDFKYSPVRATSRAFSAYLAKVRADNFKRMMNMAKAGGQDLSSNIPEAKKLADLINNGSGRGSLNFKTPEIKLPGMDRSIVGGKDIKLQRAANIAHQVFFAPKFMAAKIHRYAQVFNYKTWYKPDMTVADRIVRKEVFKSLLASAGMGYAMGELFRNMGAQVSDDPNNSDYRKIKVQDTRFDPFFGDQQYLVAASKLWSGKSTSSKNWNETTDLTAGKYGKPTRADIVGNFFANKLAPIPSFTLSLLRGKEFDGEPFEVQQAILNRTIPMVIQNLQDVYKEDPGLIPGYILPFIGVGQQTYGR